MILWSVHQIPSQPVSLKLGSMGQGLLSSIERHSGYHVERIQGHLELSKVGKCVFTTGQIELVVSSNCHRCGTEITIHIDDTLSLNYLEANVLPEHSYETVLSDEGILEQALTVDELDIGWLSSNELDCGAVISEWLLLTLEPVLHCEQPSVKRLHSGECGTALDSEPTNTYMPFANLNL